MYPAFSSKYKTEDRKYLFNTETVFYCKRKVNNKKNPKQNKNYLSKLYVIKIIFENSKNGSINRFADRY